MIERGELKDKRETAQRTEYQLCESTLHKYRIHLKHVILYLKSNFTKMLQRLEAKSICYQKQNLHLNEGKENDSRLKVWEDHSRSSCITTPETKYEINSLHTFISIWISGPALR